MGLNNSFLPYSIVIPVYNSQQSLPILLGEINTVMAKTGEEFEVIFVDDCSPDDSWEVLKSLKADHAHIRIIRLGKNVGQWMSSLCGISRAKGELILTIDDDLEYKTEDLLTLIHHYHKSPYYLIYGMPPAKVRKNWSYRLFFKVRNYLINRALGKIKTESFKIFHRNVVFGGYDEMPGSMHFEAYSHHTLSNKYISHIEVGYQSRQFGQSNYNLWKKIKLVRRYGWEFFQSPLHGFHLIGLLVILLSLLSLGLHLFTPKLDRSILLYEMGIIQVTLGLTLVALGVLGYYIARIFLLLKGKPDYFIIEEL